MAFLYAFDSVIFLVDDLQSVDQFGELKHDLKLTSVYADINTIGQRELYQAMATGVIPEIKFILSEPGEYSGQKLIKYKDVYYRVIRSYVNNYNNYLELTCSRIVNQSNIFAQNELGGNYDS